MKDGPDVGETGRTEISDLEFMPALQLLLTPVNPVHLIQNQERPRKGKIPCGDTMNPLECPHSVSIFNKGMIPISYKRLIM